MEIPELEVEKLVYEGAGLAHFEGLAVFVKGAVQGDIVRAKVVKKNKSWLKAEIIEIIKPSPFRIKPLCPMSKPCGGCDLAFVDYEASVQLKDGIIKETFKNFEGLEFLPVIKSPENMGYRCKTQYPVFETANSKKLLIGYYKEKSHEVVNIKYCPIQPSVIDEVVQFARENWTLGGYVEKKHKGLLRHINIRISSYGNEILFLLVLNADKSVFEKNKSEIEKFADLLIARFKNIKGVLVNLNPEKTNKITGDETFLIRGEDFIFEKLKDSVFKIGANSFFQVNPKCAELLFDAASNLISNKGTLLDLYGGAGTIGIFLKDKVSKITLVEENKEAVKLAKENYKLNNVLKYEVFEGCAKDKMKAFVREKRLFENILIDPPRKGSDKETLEFVSKMTDSIVYISCNPMTLKRDAELLLGFGFKFKSIQAVDMFPQTHHIECVASFKREK
ncbi:MAG: 23S rRNA (uracil(1939)-C(5))-methyltransferase RlmD [bacterium]|nr:23S rRNA (uracil(1939)-C(5))-methyltransferase RlmD [bacterium]